MADSSKESSAKRSFADLFRLFSAQTWDENAVAKQISEDIGAILEETPLAAFEVLFLMDDRNPISSWHANQLYSAASKAGRKKQILLIVQSRGGGIEPAYLISKALKRLSNGKFVCVVPRHAKSAATLICLGADEIHMGLMSQLGPIDPQIGQLPVQGMGNALETIAELCCRFPGSAEMLTNYLNKQVPMEILGYYRRLNDSAVQYAERLLQGKELPMIEAGDRATTELKENVAPTQMLAHHLVNYYKDHGFVIDFDEAKQLLGDAIVKENSTEYRAVDEVFSFLNMCSLIARHERELMLAVVGSARDGVSFWPMKTTGSPGDKSGLSE